MGGGAFRRALPYCDQAQFTGLAAAGRADQDAERARIDVGASGAGRLEYPWEPVHPPMTRAGVPCVGRGLDDRSDRTGPDRGGCRMVRLLRRDDLTVGPVGSGRFGRADAGRHHVIEDAGEAAFHRGDPAPCVGRQQGCSLDGRHGVRAAGADATERCRRARCDAVCPTPGAEGRVDTVSMAGGDVEPLAPGGRQVSGGPHRASVHGMTRFMVDFGRQDRQGGACSDRSAR